MQSKSSRKINTMLLLMCIIKIYGIKQFILYKRIHNLRTSLESKHYDNCGYKTLISKYHESAKHKSMCVHIKFKYWVCVQETHTPNGDNYGLSQNGDTSKMTIFKPK